MSKRYDCIVVGAGFSGLSAARRLGQEGLDVLVLEARDRVGGRVESGKLAGQTIDLGGMWAAPSQTSLLGLAAEFGVATYPTFLDGDGLATLGGRKMRVPGEALERGLGLLSKLQLGLLVSRLNRLCKHIDPSAPWKTPDAGELDAQTVGGWADRSMLDQKVRGFLDLVVRSVFCGEPDEVSLLFFLFYLKAAGGLETLVMSGPGGAQNLAFEGGLHQIAVRLAENVRGEISLDQAVQTIEQDGDEVSVTTHGSSYHASNLIMTVPPALMPSVRIQPPVASARIALQERQITGSCIKSWIAYAHPFWRDHGLNGTIVADSDEFSPVFDVTPTGSTTGFLVGFFDGHAATRWRDASMSERKAEAVRTIVGMFGEEGAAPLDYVERDWTREPWSRGCYGAFMPPGTLSRYGPALREPDGRIHWAGTETASAWSGYIEGAIRSGERAAKAVGRPT